MPARVGPFRLRLCAGTSHEAAKEARERDQPRIPHKAGDESLEQIVRCGWLNRDRQRKIDRTSNQTDAQSSDEVTQRL